MEPSWRLTGTDAGDFTIDDNGELAFRSIPDYERPADSNRDNAYLFKVQASDDRYYDTLDVTVTVTPVNEPPTITTTSSSATALRQNEKPDLPAVHLPRNGPGGRKHNRVVGGRRGRQVLHHRRAGPVLFR